MTSVNVLAGKVRIIGSNDKNYYLNLANDINSSKDYEVLKFPISAPGFTDDNTGWGDSKVSARYKQSTSVDVPSGSNTSLYDKYGAQTTKAIGIYQYNDDSNKTNNGINLKGSSIIALPDANTISDYVFAEYGSGSKVTNFIVLKVERIKPVTVTIKIIYSSSSPKVEYSSSVSQTSGEKVTIEVTDFSDYSKFEWYVEWVLDGTNSTNSFDFDMSNIISQMLGTHLITVVGYKKDVPYSTIISIEVK